MKFYTKVYLLLGSNEGFRLENLERALRLLESKLGESLFVSSIFETEAWGIKEQSAFLNQAVCFNVAISAKDLLKQTQAIEQKMGRTDSVRWGPRIIDIDILLYGNEIIHFTNLEVPHPFLHQRRFTLVPLHEIAADVIHPALNQSIRELLLHCTDNSSVKLFSDYEN